MHVRAALARDRAAIRQVHLAAFPTPIEADLVEQLDRDGDAIISLVAEVADAIAGHLLLSRMDVRADGEQVDALGLAPVAVVPDRQGQGVGAGLIERAIAEARLRGAEMIFVLGEPAYYGRFGFDAGAAAPFASPYAGPYFQALVLGEAPRSSVGQADYAPAFRGLA